MNNQTVIGNAIRGVRSKMLVMTILAAALALPPAGHAATAGTALAYAGQDSGAYTEPAEIGPAMSLIIGKSTLLRLPAAIDRISVGNPAVADVTLISGRELYLLGKTVGATNVILWRKGSSTTIIDVTVNIDAARLQTRIQELLPDEKGILVGTAADSIVLSGTVSSALKADQAVSITNAYIRNLNRGLVLPVVAGGGQAAPGTTISVGTRDSTGVNVGAVGSQVLNMLRVAAPQQVMLEVQVAEVSKTLLDKLGAEVGLAGSSGGWTYSILSSLLSGGAGIISAIRSTSKRLLIDGEKEDGLIKILAEPNIIAISGQEGSFLAGGKIFIPVARDNGVGGSTITLEEKEFGVGLKFTPTVLDGGRINLRVAPEVSELVQNGSPFTSTNGTTSILPSFTTRRAQTTVQLNDGQSFAIAGLIKNNSSQAVKRVPGLGEIPIFGALFRSSEFQTDRTELMFVITPRLVKPLPANYALPGDNFVPPSREDLFLHGKLEGDASLSSAATLAQNPKALPPAAPATGGFDDKTGNK